MKPKLTIGMATYDDFDGCWFTLEALKLYHDLSQVEIIVVDNRPDSPGSPHLKVLVEQWIGPDTAGARYVPLPQVTGTAVPRDTIFRIASGEFVLCVDSHVLLVKGSVERLMRWINENRGSRDLIQGPLLLDHLQGVHTHFVDTWRGEMWGIWGSAWEVCPGGDRVTPVEDGKFCRFVSLEMGNIPMSLSAACGVQFPSDLPWANHEEKLVELGWRRLGMDPDDVFEIPGQGLGLFGCFRNAWLGFNGDFRGFGGEEMYIHEKYRQAGAKCLCLGFLKWVHKFGRPNGVRYPLTRWHKVRNYILGHRELGLPLDRVHEHFVASGLLPQDMWDTLLADPVKFINPPPPKPPETISELFDAVRPPRTAARDLDRHMPLLASLASRSTVITEFSHRRESLIAFAAGMSGVGLPPSDDYYQDISGDPVVKLYSHNSEIENGMAAKAIELYPSLITADKLDSPDVPEIEESDLLFLDRLHTKARVSEELKKYAPRVRRWIVLHDTHVHATRGEDGGPGLVESIREFVTQPDSKWFIAQHTNEQYGLTVLSCHEEDRPEKPIVLWLPGYGPGTELKKILESLGIEPGPTCDCRAKADQMDMWGVEGCKQNREQIITWMREGQTRWGWRERMSAAAAAVKTGLAFKLNPLDPFPSLIDEAIRRAEEKEQQKHAG